MFLIYSIYTSSDFQGHTVHVYECGEYSEFMNYICLSLCVHTSALGLVKWK